MGKRTIWWIFIFSGFILTALFAGCAEQADISNNGSSLVETIDASDEFILFTGSSWSNVIFPHLEHSDREGSDCFSCHDHGAAVGDAKWDCGACHQIGDPENLCDQDVNHGCIMAQCDFCHIQRGGAAPVIDCTGTSGDTACCTACHTGGQIASSGVLLDSAVHGVHFQTPTLSGTTDQDGTFFYKSGELVTFYLGDLLLGQATGGPVRTILDLVDGAIDPSHPRVTNICRLLISLDQDGNPDNGITLPEDIIVEIRGRNIDFGQSTDDFGNDPDVTGLLDTLNSLGIFTANTPRTLCSVVDAQSHMTTTLMDINAKPLSTFPGDLSVSGSGGCNASGCHVQSISVNGIYRIDETNYPGGAYNGKPIYKHLTQDLWIHWNTSSGVPEWRLGENPARKTYQHHYSWEESGGNNDYPPLGGWPSGCKTLEGQQKSAVVSPLGGISGTLWVGEEVTGAYYYYDDEWDAESGTSFQWYRGSTATDAGSQVAGATATTYTLAAEDEGKYLRFGVTPKASSGKSPGDEVKSGAAGPVVVNEAPYATDVVISGDDDFVTGVLTASYQYNDDMGDVESGTTFSWYRCSDLACSSEQLIDSGTSPSLLSYTLAPSDQCKYIKFVVTAGAATGLSTGTAVSSTLFGPVSSDPLNNLPPSVSNVSIGGNANVGLQLQGQYTFTDTDCPEDADCSNYEWYRSATLNGTYTLIIGETNDTFTPPDDGTFEGAYLKFGVEPIACTGTNNIPATVIRSAAFGPLGISPSDQPPTASPVISGNVYVKAAAIGVSNYYDDEGAPDVSTYKWYVCDNSDGTSCGGVVSTTTSYIPLTADIGKYLKFEVTPRSEWGNTPGVTVTSSTKQVEFNPGDSAPVATVYSGIKVEGCLGLPGGGTITEPSYINGLGASGVDGIYQIADTIRTPVVVGCNDPSCELSDPITINGTYNGKVAYKHEAYYDDVPDPASYWIAWHDASGCRTLWWLGNSADRSRRGGTIANTLHFVGSDNGYTVPLGDWSDDYQCGNGIETSLYGGPNNKPGITGDPFVGTTLTGNYDYYDADGDAEGQTTFRWLRSSTVNGTYSDTGETGISYELEADDLGKFLKFEVTPKAVTGNSPGNAATSSYAGIGPVINPPTP